MIFELVEIFIPLVMSRIETAYLFDLDGTNPGQSAYILYVRFNHFRAVKITVKRVFDPGHSYFAVLIWRIWAPSASLRVSRISHSLGAGSPLDGCVPGQMRMPNLMRLQRENFARMGQRFVRSAPFLR
jgi:hypothetical protein